MSRLTKRFPHYSRLIALYPALYRQRYGEQMLQTLADMLEDAPDQAARMAIWVRLAADFPLSLARQQLQYTGEIMTNEVPNYSPPKSK